MDKGKKMNLQCMSIVLQQSLEEDYKKEGWQNIPKLKYHVMYKFNFVNWITLLLNGEDPHNTKLKQIVEKLKMDMLAHELAYPSGDPRSMALINAMFEAIYNL